MVFSPTFSLRLQMDLLYLLQFFFFSSRRRHTMSKRDWSSDVCSSDLASSSRVSGVSTVAKPCCSAHSLPLQPGGAGRSEERRVGKESRCKGSADDEKKEKEYTDK